MPPQTRSPHGTSLMPMQALGAPPPDLQQGGYPPPPAPIGPPPFAPARSKALDYTLKGLGLLGVAVVSGFLWWLTHNQAPATDQTAPPPQHPAGKYQFVPYVAVNTVGDCADHATAQVQAYLRQHPCVSMSRSLYTTTLSDNDKVISSVAVVRMPSAADAKGLDAVSKGNGTGHVEDQVEEGYQVPNGPTSLEAGGYESRSTGSTEVIVITAFLNGAEDNSHALAAQPTQDLLKAVSTDALNQNLGR
jgi:hypothetical protein